MYDTASPDVKQPATNFVPRGRKFPASSFMKESDILKNLIEGYRTGETDFVYPILGVDVRFQVKDHAPFCIGDEQVSKCVWHPRKVVVGWKQKATGRQKSWTFGMKGSAFAGGDPDVAAVVSKLHGNAWYYGLYRDRSMYYVTKHLKPVVALWEVRTLAGHLATAMWSYFLNSKVIYTIRSQPTEIQYKVERAHEERERGVYAMRKVQTISARPLGTEEWMVILTSKGLASTPGKGVDAKWLQTTEQILLEGRDRLHQKSILIKYKK